MKSVLQRQIKKNLSHLSEKELEAMGWFFWAVEDMYQSFDDDRSMMDRSLELSSQELMENNESLKKRWEEIQKVLDNLLKAVQKFQGKRNKDTSDMQAEDLSLYLSELIAESEENKAHTLKQKKYLSTIVDNIGEGLVVIRPDRTIEIYNTMASDLTGFTGKEVLEKTCDNFIQFFDSKLKHEYEDIIWKCLHAGKTELYFDSISLRNRKGKYVPISVALSPVLSQNKNERGCILLFRDITKQIELDHMKDEFVSIASHELRTPMTIINGFSSLILDENIGKLNDAQRNYMGKIKRNTLQLINLVNDMLHISRCEAGKIELDMTMFDLWELMDEVTHEFEEMFDSKNITLSLSSCSTQLYSDSWKIRQVLVNLIGNAYKFTKEEWRVDVMSFQDGNDVVVQVGDTGEGISKENIKKLFKKFSQVNSHLHDKAEGTGLGLAICKMMIEALGGSIKVESEEWKGSVFSFRLPISSVQK